MRSNMSQAIYNRLTEGRDYSNTVDTFNEIITEWDFLGDVTDPYVSGIGINGDDIEISCEMWDPDIDDYIGCDGGTFTAPDIVDMIKKADFNNCDDVYAEARPIFDALCQLVDWDEVSKELYSKRDKELEEE